MFFMIFTTVLSWLSWMLVIWGIDPSESGVFGFALFYTTLFLSCVGSLTLTGVLFRLAILKRSDVISREVRIAFRHAVLLSIVGITSLILIAQVRFYWSIFFPIILCIIGLEYVFLLGDASRRI